MTNDDAVTVGLIGCGRIAQLFHLPVLAGLKAARLVAVADADADARAAAKRVAPRAAFYDAAEPLLAHPSLAVVVICTPPHTHAGLTRAALAAGLDVYVEKPPALRSAETAELLAALPAGRVTRVGFNFRRHPLVVDAQRRLAAGELGELVAIRGVFTAAARELPAWKRQRTRGGGALMDLAIHHLDLVAALAGPLTVTGAQCADDGEVEEATATVAGTLRGGALFSGMYAALGGCGENRLELIGRRGHLTVDTAAVRPGAVRRPPDRLARVRRALRAVHPAEVLSSPWGEPSFAAALGEFVAACGGAAPAAGLAAADLAAGHAALQAVEAARRAAGVQIV